ncbi:unnamed protein product [Hyaloperonospora brassicae]|uniref:Cytochrome b5 heme-binding domain-containing protein n=1 Tax=Hyaloperonospora brassicae TaxID=162125 RepID=A0AAV0V3Y7_HYABA|nr:unnamed protein product [Hyaloperonospora brassicae]
MTKRLVLTGVAAAAVAVGSYYCSHIVSRRRGGRPPRHVAGRLAAAPLQYRRELQLSGPWVALCGTAFDVAGDPFFDATCAGVYSSWVGHDVTFLILQLGLVTDAADDAEATASYVDREWQLEALQGDDEAARRGRELLHEWFARFCSRYRLVAQLRDYYVGVHWDALRAELLPSDSESRPVGGKCPLGFGATMKSKAVSYNEDDGKELRTITFQGRLYDVSRMSLFHPESGRFAHFVGHDVTYALAIQSVRVEDLDVVPERTYTFAEQLMLERYRSFFARELALVEIDKTQCKSDDAGTNVLDLHQLIENSSGIKNEERVLCLKKTLESASAKHVNALCSRTAMTPLHKAVEKNRFDLVKVLLDAGADIEARAALYDGETPLEMAYRFHFDDIAAHLKAVSTGGD